MTRYLFGPFELDPAAGRLLRAGTPVPLPARQIDVLATLVARAGQVISKDALVEAAWRDVAVTDNSLEQAISSLRRALGNDERGEPTIETVPRQGYRFAAAVRSEASRADDETLEALLAPHRAWVEGRAALETLAIERVAQARGAFERALAHAQDDPAAHVGLANACVMQFEMTRADGAPDLAALETAALHARDACRLNAEYGEGWATLGFVLDRTGRNVDARAALARAVSLEPDNWRHYFRLALVSWGEARLRAAHRTQALLPGFPLAHWLAATVHVARQALDDAERELTTGLQSVGGEATTAPFSSVALEWLLGLIHLSRGDERGARARFDRELATEASGHLYARECCANVWYAIGAAHLHAGRRAEAADAFAQAIRRVQVHPLAHAAMAATPVTHVVSAAPLTTEHALAAAVRQSLDGDHAGAASQVERLLAHSDAGSQAWLLPVEPMLRVSAHADVWSTALARLRNRAA